MAIKFSQFTEKVDSANIDGLVGYFGNQNIRISPSDLVGTITLNASNITTGTLADARLSSNVALKDVDNNFSTNQTIVKSSSGNTGVGETFTPLTIDSNEISSYIQFLGNGSQTQGILFGDSDANVGGITYSHSTNSISFRTNDTADRLVIDSSGNVGIKKTDPAVELDVNGEIRASNGILFGTDTAAANALDDYEEGTFTATLKGSVSDPTTPVTTTGRYTKIGDLVTVRVNFFSVTTTGASGIVSVDGLPFTVSGLTIAPVLLNIFDFNGGTSPVAYVNNSTTVQIFRTEDDGSFNDVLHNAGIGRWLVFTMSYFV